MFRPTRKRCTQATIGLAALALLLTACGSDDAASSASSTTTVPAAGSATAKAKATIDVRITDSAFDVSGPLRPGGTIRFENASDEASYVQVRRVNDDATLSEALAAVDDQEKIDSLAPEVSAPGNIVMPGYTVGITDPDLSVGEYVLLDFFPIEGDKEGGTHVDAGLVGSFAVSGDPAGEPSATESYTVTSGKAIDGPEALTAGHHTLGLKFASTDLGYPTLLRLDGDQTVDAAIEDVNAAFGQDVLPIGTGTELASFFVTSVFPPAGDVLYVGADLEPGTYALVQLTYGDDGAGVAGPERIELTVT